MKLFRVEMTRVSENVMYSAMEITPTVVAQFNDCLHKDYAMPEDINVSMEDIQQCLEQKEVGADSILRHQFENGYIMNDMIWEYFTDELHYNETPIDTLDSSPDTIKVFQM